jgi:hypothetical protein
MGKYFNRKPSIPHPMCQLGRAVRILDGSCEPLCVGCTGMTYALRMYLMGCEDKCGNGEKNGVGITSGKAAKCAGRTLGA